MKSEKWVVVPRRFFRSIMEEWWWLCCHGKMFPEPYLFQNVFKNMGFLRIRLFWYQGILVEVDDHQSPVAAKRKGKNMMRKALSGTAHAFLLKRWHYWVYVVASIRPFSWAEPPAHVGTVHNITFADYIAANNRDHDNTTMMMNTQSSGTISQPKCLLLILYKQSNRY